MRRETPWGFLDAEAQDFKGKDKGKGKGSKGKGKGKDGVCAMDTGASATGPGMLKIPLEKGGKEPSTIPSIIA